jgi:hypothetical protein
VYIVRSADPRIHGAVFHRTLNGLFARIAAADAGPAASPLSVCSGPGTRSASFCRVIGGAARISGNDSSWCIITAGLRLASLLVRWLSLVDRGTLMEIHLTLGMSKNCSGVALRIERR